MIKLSKTTKSNTTGAKRNPIKTLKVKTDIKAGTTTCYIHQGNRICVDDSTGQVISLTQLTGT